MSDLKGSVSLVTGASSGIGKAIAWRMAQEGSSVIATGRNLASLEKLREAFPDQVEVVAGDIRREAVLRELANGLHASAARPILVNSAGIAEFSPFGNQSWEQVSSQFETNFVAAARLIHLCLPTLFERKGTIINISSIATEVNFSGAEAYQASKSALLSLGKGLLHNYRRQGLRLTTVTLGATDSPIWDKLESTPDRAAMVQLDEVADLVVNLASKRDGANMDEVVLMPQNGIL